jgi:hypothetical protein
MIHAKIPLGGAAAHRIFWGQGLVPQQDCWPMPADFQDILFAFEFASGDGSNEALLCRRTGRIYWRSPLSGLDEIADELSDDVEDDDNYLPLPDKRELGLGKPLVLDFAREFLPKDFDDVRTIFSKRGAYKKFRALLIKRRVLDRWYNFESKATEQALREWCELNSIEFTVSPPGSEITKNDVERS